MTPKPDVAGTSPPPEEPAGRPGIPLWDLVRGAFEDPSRRVTVLGGAACLGLLLLLFRDTLWDFYYSWTTDENYSHGFLVPLLSLYFANQVAAKGPAPVRGGAILGGLLLAAAILVRLVAIPLPLAFLGELALIAGLAGLFAVLAGSAALRRYWFPFFFLLFMVPLPIALYTRVASPLQLMASQMASAVMNLTGLPVLCEGNHMTLPGGVQMFVAEACSGMRQMTGFLALATAVAYLTTKPGWYRAVVVLAALPIALTANVARIVLTGYVMHYVNPQYASGAYHTLEGILMMGFGLLLLNSLCVLMDQLTPRAEGVGFPGRAMLNMNLVPLPAPKEAS
ncbi:Transmembrane exosortase (Exosortase_EpsH) [Aquisphaera giovannonii]|uniref:Transmembrane exosortase (Exosortase_EpsH) n=1 Tax=Aquisphaera giovannonii TaxID=406548 RepID=A0A5B9VUC8_9BACT|nr:exosortase/archaeosortase family protein [Aquisphaera giovannonii]QEH31699.1 Transmembrane exosortase (Exosortase_EpsH) [Aquisphaera giovannonii]